MRHILDSLSALFRRLRHDRRGNVLMLVGFAIIPMTLATGMSIDYARAARLKTKLDAAADAAALSAVTQTAMKLSDDVAAQNAKNIFNGQVVGLPGLDYDSTAGVNTAYAQQSGGVTNSREITVTYTANSINAFGGLFNMAKIPLTGSATAKAAAPNIDFYLMLDTSPSMLLPATTSGLAAQVAATGGCAFACHQTDLNPNDSAEVICTPNANGPFKKNGQKVSCIDYLQVARNNNIVLRTDLMIKAVQDLTDVATATAQQSNAKYRIGINSFDYAYKQVWPTTKSSDGFWVDNNLSNVKAHVTDTSIPQWCVNNYRTCGGYDNDTGTNFTAAFDGVSGPTVAPWAGTMPVTPGNGTNATGDTPQAVLFIITDGMRDEVRANGSPEGPISQDRCDAIKARGIRIAVLYTEYLPESASIQWAVDHVKTPYLVPNDLITPALQSCASAGLFYKVTTNGDISAALSDLFVKAVKSARLTK